jgi:hypothetical protein
VGWAGHVARRGLRGNHIGCLWGGRREGRPLGGQRRGWLDDVRMDLGAVGSGVVGWIGLARDGDTWRALV